MRKQVLGLAQVHLTTKIQAISIAFGIAIERRKEKLRKLLEDLGKEWLY
ncbi:hypothetical protein [[Eubacterium] cellulosolvens]